MARVDLHSVSKNYSSLAVIRDFTLTVEDGEFVVLVGPSGCGKSTILRMIAGLTDVSGGEIMIDGCKVNHLEPGKRDVAMVFQNYALYPHMNVFENMAFSLKIRKIPAADISRAIMETSEILDISDLLKRKPGQLSGGQRQRVALGRAIVRKPKVFLMDEPLSNLDAQLRMHMRTEIIKLHRRLKSTFIYVTHDQVEAMTMGDRIVIMKDGLVQQVGPPEEIYRNPANAFVAKFIGSPPINLFEAKLSSTSKSLVSPDSGLSLELDICRNGSLNIINGKKLLLGIRPEDVQISFHSPSAKAIRANVDLVENTGSEKIVFAGAGCIQFVAKASADFPLKGGEDIWLHFPPASVLVFDRDSGLAITTPSGDNH